MNAGDFPSMPLTSVVATPAASLSCPKDQAKPAGMEVWDAPVSTSIWKRCLRPDRALTMFTRREGTSPHPSRSCFADAGPWHRTLSEEASRNRSYRCPLFSHPPDNLPCWTDVVKSPAFTHPRTLHSIVSGHTRKHSEPQACQGTLHERFSGNSFRNTLAHGHLQVRLVK